MSSREQDIFDLLKAELDKITGVFTDATVTNVLIDIFEADNEGVTKFPWVGLFPTETKLETGTTQGSSGKQNEASFVVLCYVKDEDPTTELYSLLAEIKKQIEDDPKFGQTFPVFAHVDEVAFMVTSEMADQAGSDRLGMMEITVRVDYRHARDTP